MAARRRTSKKQSGANSGSTPPEPTFFVDYSLGGVSVPQALKSVGAAVEIHLDWFAPDTPDPALLEAIGAKGWVFLSKDGNIRRRPLETMALMRAGVKAFILTSGNLRAAEQAAAFLAALPRMRAFCSERRGPFIARVTRTGDVEIIREPAEAQG
jgi:hypothetical protein